MAKLETLLDFQRLIGQLRKAQGLQGLEVSEAVTIADRASRAAQGTLAGAREAQASDVILRELEAAVVTADVNLRLIVEREARERSAATPSV